MKNFQALALILLVACAGPALAQSDPTPHQVYEAARSGNLAEAQQMIGQVLRDHPTSSEAHYVAAQVYARAGNLAEARQQLATAEQLKPGLPFVKSRQALQNLQAELAAQGPGSGTAFTVPYSRPRPAGIPWGAILIIGAGVAVIWIVMRRRAASYSRSSNGAVIPGVSPPPGYGPGHGPGYGPGYGPGPGIGSGIAGGLASGLAVGAGVVAGEELARHFLDSDRPGAGNMIVPPAGAAEANPSPDMGGSDFGVSDGGSWDDSSGGDSFGGGDFGGGGDWT
jgi:uncharacterized protein